MNPDSQSLCVDSCQIEGDNALDMLESTSDCHAGFVQPRTCAIVREQMSEFAVEMARWLAWQPDPGK